MELKDGDQLLAFDPGERVRRRREGRTRIYWRELEGRVERLRAGELYSGNSENLRLATIDRGINFSDAVSLIGRGWWKIGCPNGSVQIVDHPDRFDQHDVREVMRCAGWTFSASTEGVVTAYPPGQEITDQ